ncbi:MAG: carboxypeptidase-like regulatory domain-containing protein [Candidatus Methylacidiphilales bacterium]
MNHLKYILTLAFLAVGLNLFAQTDTVQYGKLEVKVIDAKTKKPIEFAMVKLEAKDFIRAKFSDADGEIVLDSLRTKTYLLTVTITGYRKKIYEKVVIDKLTDTFLTIELNEIHNLVYITLCGPQLIKKDGPTQQNFNNKQIMRMPY